MAVKQDNGVFKPCHWQLYKIVFSEYGCSSSVLITHQRLGVFVNVPPFRFPPIYELEVTVHAVHELGEECEYLKYKIETQFTNRLIVKHGHLDIDKPTCLYFHWKSCRSRNNIPDINSEHIPWKARMIIRGTSMIGNTITHKNQWSSNWTYTWFWINMAVSHSQVL